LGSPPSTPQDFLLVTFSQGGIREIVVVVAVIAVADVTVVNDLEDKPNICDYILSVTLQNLRSTEKSPS
jgi:hypothetical protein